MQQKKAFSTSQNAMFEQWVKTNPELSLENHEILYQSDKEPQYQTSETEQGVKIITEQSSFPSMMDFGILAHVGSRNETAVTSGALFLHQSLHMAYGEDANIFIQNYIKNQYSGAQVLMSYDHESTYWKSSFLHRDFEPMLDLMLQTSLREKKFVLQNASLLEQNKYMLAEDDLMFQAAYGSQNLGMPLRGINDQMTEEQFIDFQRKFITPQNVTISAANIQNHDEFVQRIQSKLFEFPEFLQRQREEQPNAQYTGGEIREETEDEEIVISIVFESVDWKHKNMAALQVINSILGNSSSFSTGGPGKGMHARTSQNMLNKLYFIESAGCVIHHFSDSGLFGIKVSGSHSSKNNLIEAAVSELKKLADPINDVELLRGKNMLYSLINLSLERQVDRLEEITKNIFSFGKLKMFEYESDIYKVTSDQINQIMTDLINSKPTIVIRGKGANEAYSYDQICNLLKTSTNSTKSNEN